MGTVLFAGAWYRGPRRNYRRGRPRAAPSHPCLRKLFSNFNFIWTYTAFVLFLLRLAFGKCSDGNVSLNVSLIWIDRYRRIKINMRCFWIDAQCGIMQEDFRKILYDINEMNLSIFVFLSRKYLRFYSFSAIHIATQFSMGCLMWDKIRQSCIMNKFYCSL